MTDVPLQAKVGEARILHPFELCFLGVADLVVAQIQRLQRLVLFQSFSQPRLEHGIPGGEVAGDPDDFGRGDD